MIRLICDTHGEKIITKPCDVLIHLGDYVSGRISGPALSILVRGNKDNPHYEEFNFEVDALRIGEFYFSHEPMERLPRGAAYNIHGHTHLKNPVDFGYSVKEWHIPLPPNELICLDDVHKLVNPWY